MRLESGLSGSEDNPDIYTISESRVIFSPPLMMSTINNENQEFTWYRRKKRDLEIKWMLLLAISIALSLVLSIILLGNCLKYGPTVLSISSWQSALLRHIKGSKTWKDADSQATKIDQVCVTPECSKKAESILKSLNREVAPCDDFYEFACGNWIKKNPCPDLYPYVSVIDTLNSKPIEQIKSLLENESDSNDELITNITRSYYKMCMNAEAISKKSNQSIHKIIEQIGDWPMATNKQWNPVDFDWMEATVKLRWLGISSDAFIKIQPVIDVFNNTIYRIGINEPKLSLDRNQLIGNSSVIKHYINFMKKTASTYGGQREMIEHDVYEVLEFERELSLLTMPEEAVRESIMFYRSMTVADLSTLAPSIPWVEFLSGLIGREISDDQFLLVKNFNGFITRLELLLKKTEERVLANYLSWTVVRALLPYLGPKYDQLEVEFWDALYDKHSETPRWVKCVDEVSNYLGPALQSMYARAFYSESVKETATRLAISIEQIFNESLSQNKWMDNDTKIRAMDKLDNLNMFIAYPDDFLNASSVSKMFEKMDYNEGSSYLENTLNMSLWNINMLLERVDQPNGRIDWAKTQRISDANAFYSASDNALFLPMGILTPEVFSPNLPSYLNYGTIGYAVGHEMIHGFDNLGRHFDKSGNRNNWWTNESQVSFDAHSSCFVNQYSKYHLINDIKLNGQLSLDENIADNGGLHIAYQAYQSTRKYIDIELKMPGLNYTSDQLFWISYAQLWCANYKNSTLEIEGANSNHVPGRYRVIGSLSNNVDFSNSFKCPIGSPMNPEKKCFLW
ncbi:neprilysin-2-like [Tetranychus urticae]|uniref:neprilysin-2-like n=1 Tax=Tetranychus urticae TaxID=32264 RepID=UPI00077B89AB|nr:neprilysin-2-like [Tetranychus urticae]